MTSGDAKVPKADRVQCNMLEIGYYRSWPILLQKCGVAGFLGVDASGACRHAPSGGAS